MVGLSLTVADGLTLLVALAGLGALVGIGEGLRAWGVEADTTRRVVHAGVSLFVVATPRLFSGPLPLYLLAGLFVVVNGVALVRGWWAGMHEARPESWGTVALPLAVVPALLVTWSVSSDRVYVLQAAFLVLALADPLASAMGEGERRRTWVPGASWIGSGVFLGVSFALVGATLLAAGDWAVGRIVGASVGVAVVATATEAISHRGWDNLFVVLGVVLVLTPLHGVPAAVDPLGVGLVVGTGVGALAHWGRALDAAGAVGGGLFAASLVGLGGWAWALPGFAFFLLSSALSWLPGEGTGDGETVSEPGPNRSLRQVMANGGIAWGLLGAHAVLPSGSGGAQSLCYAGFLGALAAAAADTWATELGSRLSKRPWSLRTLRRVPPGTSGAVSLVGTAAAALGAGSVVGAGWLVEGGLLSATGQWVGAGAAGLVGMAADSVAGATVQAQYRDPETGHLVERPISGRSPVRGWRGVGNEIVNLVGTTIGAAVAAVMVGALG